MRAVFLVESGSNFGFGHCSRSYALAEELLYRGWTIDIFAIGDKFCREPSINVSIHLIMFYVMIRNVSSETTRGFYG